MKGRIRIYVLGPVVFFQKIMPFTFTINRKPDQLEVWERVS